MADVGTLRAEIKSWERQFKATHGKAPSVQDIKDNPAIAEKYKRYKKLSKSTSEASTSQPHPPSTPPRPKTRPNPSSILPKSQPVITAPPQSTSNPFSPTKPKTKVKAIPQSKSTTVNPFATPFKTKNKVSRTISPDPFPLIASSQPPPLPHQQEQDQVQDESQPNHALLRARKRLRGEPVSPSPIKQKRQRTTSFASLPFSKPSPIQDRDSDSEDGEADNSFVFDSPVKVPMGGKDFKLLFEEMGPQLDGKGKGVFGRSKTVPADINGGLFGGNKGKRASSIFGDVGSASQPSGSTSGQGKKSGNGVGKRVMLNGMKLSKDTLWDADEVPPVPDPRKGSAGRSSRKGKRSLSDTEDRDEEMEDESGVVILGGEDSQVEALIPPSPPPASKTYKPRFVGKDKGKGKAKATAGSSKSRKKVKVSEEPEEEGGEDGEEESTEGEVKVKEKEWSWNRVKMRGGEEMDFDFEDPTTRLGLRPNQPSHGPDPSATEEEERVEIDLPEHLRRVLAISPSCSSMRDVEERMVRGLLKGERTERYDGRKGGEIWDVGEDEGEGEDGDWEGEGVPWEVGEL